MTTREMETTVKTLNKDLGNAEHSKLVLCYAYGKVQLMRKVSGSGVTSVSRQMTYRDMGTYLAGMRDVSKLYQQEG